MIAAMRKFTQSVVFQLMMWAFLFMMAFGSGFVFFNEKNSKNWVIKAYNQSISDAKFNSIIDQIKASEKKYNIAGVVKDDKKIKQQACQVAINDLLLQAASENVGLTVSQAHLEQLFVQKIQHLAPQFVDQSGKINEQMLQQAINPVSVQDLVDETRDQLLQKTMHGLLGASVYAASFEIDLLSNAQYANKKIDYITFSLDSYLAKVSNNKFSTDQLERFYKKPMIAQQFKTLEKRSGTVWVFEQKDFIQTISDSECKAFYDKNKAAQFVITPAMMQVRRLLIKSDDAQVAQAKIQDIYQTALQAPDQFEKLVREFSQDAHANTGGLSEFFAHDDKKMDYSIVEVSFDHLTRDGQISAPIKTTRGFEIVQRVKKNNPVYKEFSQVLPLIKETIASEKFKQRFAQDAGRVANQAKYNKAALDSFINRYKGSLINLDMQAKSNKADIVALFKTEQGRFSVAVEGKQGYIVLCQTIEKSVLPPLAQVKDKVLEILKKEQAEEMLKKDLQAAVLSSHKKELGLVANEYQESVHHAQVTFKDGVLDKSPILKKRAIENSLLFLNHQGAVSAAISEKNGYLLKVNNLEEVAQSVYQQELHGLKALAYYIRFYQINDSFIDSLYRTAKINNELEIKQDILKSTEEV